MADFRTRNQRRVLRSRAIAAAQAGRRQARRRRLKDDAAAESTWANAELRSAIDGVILEKNINRGILVDPSDDLFKIADTSHVIVRAQVYEEDLPTLRCLPPDKRHWKIDLKSDPFDEPVPGMFEVIIGIIDPAQHTATVMGVLDNVAGRMNLGQFVTATIELDSDPRWWRCRPNR